MMKTLVLPLALLAMPLSAETDEFGTLNPDEMTWQNNLTAAERGETSMMMCASGYMMTKSGDHETARKIFEACAEDGWTGTMTWLSQLDNNGLAGAYDPDAAAEWDRKAAELGDPVGKFNYGLALIRGHGVQKDEEAGRALIDEAAATGLPIARRMVAADYDPEEVTPDADNWKYAPLF
ncbi:tetratricopeptide repeat protein [Aestuariibius sp. 2305UL40-4]|uniref:tetratricopeptide repeat protein n=1 Tax=Aestuariibius violaceus TaxID=3234132 RepID=UPI00346AA20C